MPFCPFCPNKSFHSQWSLYAHARDSKKIRHPRCDSCELIFANQLIQSAHMDAAHPSECPACWKYFRSRAGMLQHKANTHGRYRCRPCQRRFEKESDRDEHYRSSRAHRGSVHTGGSPVTSQVALQLPATDETVSPEQTENYSAADGHEMVEHNDEDHLVRSHPDTLEYAALFPLPPSPVAFELRTTD